MSNNYGRPPGSYGGQNGPVTGSQTAGGVSGTQTAVETSLEATNTLLRQLLTEAENTADSASGINSGVVTSNDYLSTLVDHLGNDDLRKLSKELIIEIKKIKLQLQEITDKEISERDIK